MNGTSVSRGAAFGKEVPTLVDAAYRFLDVLRSPAPVAAPTLLEEMAEAAPELPDDIARLLRLLADERFQEAWADINIQAADGYARGCVVRVGVLRDFLNRVAGGSR